MKLKSTEIIKESIKPYWEDESLSTKDYTSIKKYSTSRYEIELKQELGYFTHTPEKILIYRTYIKIYEGENLIKRKMFYGSNGKKWEQFIKDFIEE
jgi:hypothetical protein